MIGFELTEEQNDLRRLAREFAEREMIPRAREYDEKEIFPREVYQFSSIPAEVIPRDVTLICLSAFLICSIAALIPAYFAARLDPVKALRFE